MVLQKQLKRFYVSERGFTLVELLIVVAIIAVLAAIAIPSFSRYLERAYRASMLSDAKNISTQLETYYGDNFTYVTAVNSVGPGAASIFLDGGTGYQVNASSGNSVTITVTATTYTIVVSNPKLSGGKSPLSYAVNGAITCTWADGSGC